MSRRTERVASTIHQELAMIILRELNDPRLIGMPSITRVKVADDLSTADIYITVMGTPGQQTAALNALKHSAGLMRTKLTKQLTLRAAPFLSFHLDEDLKKELELEAVMRKVELDNQEADRRRAEAEAAAAAASPEGAVSSTEASSPTESANEPKPSEPQDKPSND